MPIIYFVNGGKLARDICHILHPGGDVCLFCHPHRMLLMSSSQKFCSFKTAARPFGIWYLTVSFNTSSSSRGFSNQSLGIYQSNAGPKDRLGLNVRGRRTLKIDWILGIFRNYTIFKNTNQGGYFAGSRGSEPNSKSEQLGQAIYFMSRFWRVRTRTRDPTNSQLVICNTFRCLSETWLCRSVYK
jgi:hypothetical protein